jgi:methylglutaconyl-CoA hydratase
MKDMVHFSLQQNKKDSEILFDMFQAIYSCQAPILGVAHGAAFGGALGLLACCDYVLCEEKTQLCFSEVKLGIAPAVISFFVLKKCALGFVNPLMISGRVFNATEALQTGLVHVIVDEEALPDKLLSAINWFKEAGPQAVRATKKLLQTADLNKQTVTSLIAELRVSTEGQDGLRAFLEKRNPSWRKS